jgi:hypothetical protein
MIYRWTVLTLSVILAVAITGFASKPPQNAAANVVSCSMIPLNADTFGNIGILFPNGATPTGGALEVRLANDNYSDCTQTQGLCPSPHSDIAVVQRWDVTDQGQRQALGFLMYNAKGAPTKNVRLCYSYVLTGPVPGAAPLGHKILELPLFDDRAKYSELKK